VLDCLHPARLAGDTNLRREGLQSTRAVATKWRLRAHHLLCDSHYPEPMGEWRFLTNHAGVLACVANEPGIRVRDIADRVGITERAANRIVSELEASGYLTRHRRGARNFYELHPDLPLRHPLVHDHSVADLLALFADSPESERRESGTAGGSSRFARSLEGTPSRP
jgi:hypothetical protein